LKTVKVEGIGIEFETRAKNFGAAVMEIRRESWTTKYLPYEMTISEAC
jgi:hypothetical protein